jgi:hypothetical protein
LGKLKTKALILVLASSGTRLREANMSEDRAWRTIIECVEKAGLGKDEETTIHGRRKIHQHSFRKFFFSKVVGIIGETVAHAMMGHGSHLKTYYKKTEEERGRDYLKCMPHLTIPHLTIFSESPEMSRWKEDTRIKAKKYFIIYFCIING